MKVFINRLRAIWFIVTSKNFILLHNMKQDSPVLSIAVRTDFTPERDMYLVKRVADWMKRRIDHTPSLDSSKLSGTSSTVRTSY